MSTKLRALVARLDITDEERAELTREIERAGVGCDCLDGLVVRIRARKTIEPRSSTSIDADGSVHTIHLTDRLMHEAQADLMLDGKVLASHMERSPICLAAIARAAEQAISRRDFGLDSFDRICARPARMMHEPFGLTVAMRREREYRELLRRGAPIEGNRRQAEAQARGLAALRRARGEGDE